MKLKLLITFLVFQWGFSQETKMSIKDYINFSDLPSKSKDTPGWANQFYTNPDKINIKKLKDDINEWVIEEKKERNKKLNKKSDKESDKELGNDLEENISENPIVRFALNFTNSVPNSWINDAGFIEMPSKNAFFKQTEEQEKVSPENLNKTTNKNALVGNWSQIGSKEILENGKQIVTNTCIYYISVAPTSTNTRLASGETKMLYKTTNGGTDWFAISENHGPSAFHPTDVNKIILGSNPFKLSTDGGSTWTVKNVVAQCNEIIWSQDGLTILASTTQGIYVSSDGGSTFVLRQSGSFLDVEFKPGSSTIAYAITNEGVFYKSTDAGITWVIKTTSYNITSNKKGFLLAVTAANPELVSIASLTGINFDTDNKVELIKSTNSGDSFASLSVKNIRHSQGYYDFVFGISPIDVNTYFVGVCSFFKSTDGGLTFNAIGGYESSTFGTHPDMQDMVIFGNTVVLSTDGGVSESTDNFTNLANWKSTCRGLDSFDYWGFDLGFNTDQMGGGKFHNGNSMYNPEWNNGKAVYMYGAEEADGKAIFSRPNSIYFSGESKNFKQIDVTYNPNYADSFPFTMENNLFYFGERNSDTTSNTTNSNIIYSGKGNNVLISYDNGVTSQILKDFGSLVWDVKTTRKDANVLYVMTQSTGLWKTSDGGTIWTPCNLTFNNVDLAPNGRYLFIDISQTNANEIWLTYNKEYTNSRIFKSTDGGLVWTDLNTLTLKDFQAKQIVHQYGSDGGVYLMGQAYGTSKCYYRNNTLTDWVDYSSNLIKHTATSRNVFLKPSYYKEKLRVAGTNGVQEIAFYEKSKPVAQPTTNIKEICVNQEVKFSDYSILDYAGATWQWSFSKTPIYLNGTSATSRDPILKFLSTGAVDATLKVTNSSGQTDTKTITNFVNVNFDSANCLDLNSDNDYEVSCVNTIPSAAGIAVGAQTTVTNFNGATTGKFLVKINLLTNCNNYVASLTALVNLDTDQISVIRYYHFEDGLNPVTGNNTNNVTSFSNRWAQVNFSLNNKTLYLKHIFNYCASIGQTNKTVTLQQSCWQPYGATGIYSGDFAELQNCKNQIPQSAAVSDTNGILVTTFANATSGLFYVNVNGFTSCNNATNSLKAIINLDSDVINVLEYKHYGSNAIAQVSGNEMATINSISTANAPISYYLNNNKLYASRPSDACGGATFRINPSCWSAMDDDNNGIDNALQPSNCNNAFSGNIITNADVNLIKDFSSFAPKQKGVFVTLNIGTSCNNTTATAYLNVDFDNNLIHVISYKHFGSTTFSTVLNNDTANVYSESAANGKLKFSLINDKLYIQRVSTPCAGSNYQVTNSCYSLGSDQVLAMENFISNTVATAVAYPNPTSNSFTIDTKSSNTDFSLSVYDINGKFITSKFEKSNNNLLQVDLTQNTDGIYFVVLFDRSNNKYNYLKIIKK